MLLSKTSRESQNAALRTSHQLSNVSSCSFQKYWESIFFCLFYSSDRSDSSDGSEKIHATSPQKICNLLLFCFNFFYFLSSFGKSISTHLTTNVMFSGQHFAIRAMFLKTPIYNNYKNVKNVYIILLNYLVWNFFLLLTEAESTGIFLVLLPSTSTSYYYFLVLVLFITYS